MERNEDSFERDLRGLGLQYQRKLTGDPAILLRELKARPLVAGRAGTMPRQRWWIAAAAVVLLFGVGGGLLHQWSASQDVGASLNLTYILPKTRTTIVYATSSSYLQQTRTYATGKEVTVMRLRSQGEISEVITPVTGGRYKISLTYAHLTSQLDNQPPHADTGFVTTYLVSKSGRVLSVRVVPAGLKSPGNTDNPLLPQMPLGTVRPGQTWTTDHTFTLGGASYKTSTTHTYAGLVRGYLKVLVTAKVALPGGKESVSGYLLLDRKSHLLDRMVETTSGTFQTSTPATSTNGTRHVVIHVTMRRVS